MRRVQFIDKIHDDWADVLYTHETEEEAMVDLVVRKFRWPDDQRRIVEE